MKARLNGTKDAFVEITEVSLANKPHVLYDANRMEFEQEKTQQESTSDHWQDLRERAAIAAVQGYTSCKCQLVGAINLAMAEGIAEQAILIADALVKKLKGE